MTPGGDAVVIVLTTLPDEPAARALATTLVEEHLIACANIVPAVTSVYRWEGAVQEDAEVLVVMKCTSETAARLRDRVEELHPYDVPELLVLPVTGGAAPYLAWVAAEVAP